MAIGFPERFYRGKNRLRFHDHSLAAAKGGVINHVVLVSRPISDVMNSQVEPARVLGPLHHAFRERGAASFWKQCQNIDTHPGSVLWFCTRWCQAQRARSDLVQDSRTDLGTYSTISRVAR